MKSTKYILLAAGAALLVLLGTAGSDGCKGQHKLGGAWIGVGVGETWDSLQCPLDAEGQTFAIRVAMTSWGPEIAGLLKSFGADTPSEGVGQSRMISRDTAKWTFMGYAQNTESPGVIGAIFVYSGTWKFTSQDTAVLNYSLNVYLPTADGYPDLNNPVIIPGVLPVTGLTDTAKRVPILE